MKKIITFLIASIVLIGLISSADWTPYGYDNINLRDGDHNLTNVKYAQGTTSNYTIYYGNGSQLTGISSGNNIIDDNLYNASELEEQTDGKLGILDSFINLLIDNRIVMSFVQSLGFYNETQSDNRFTHINGTNSNFTYTDYYPQGSTPSYSEGRVFYDDEQKTLVYFNDEEDVAVNIGEELLMRVKNTEGSTINNGDVVYIMGSTGDNPQVKLAKSDNLSTSRMIGMVTENSISNNAVGYITTFGRVRELNTSTYSEGDFLYVSATNAGEYTNVKPSFPNKSFRVGTVIRSSENQGQILIDIDRELDNFNSGCVIFANGEGELYQDCNFSYNKTTDTLSVKNVNMSGNLNMSNNNITNIGNEGNFNVNSSNYWDNYDVAGDLNNLIISHWDNLTNVPSGLDDGDDYEADTNCSVDNSCGLITYDSELDYTTDTNASTACSGTDTYLSGDGTCETEQYEADTNTNIIDDNLYNTSELEEQADGKLGIFDTFLTNFIDSWFSGKDTDNLTEGSTNLYFTEARAINAISNDDAYLKNDGDTATGDYNIEGGNMSVGKKGTADADNTLYESYRLGVTGSRWDGSQEVEEEIGIYVEPKPWGGFMMFEHNGDDLLSVSIPGGSISTGSSAYLNIGSGGVRPYATIGDLTFRLRDTDTYMYFLDSSNNEIMTIKESGEIGIGTSSPLRKLHINGSVLANGTINTTQDICIEGGNCLSDAGTGSGDITEVLTGLTPYLLGGSASGSVNLDFNETYLNNTIDARDTDTTISNCSVDGSCDAITYDSELDYTTDTNASTECATDEVLLGNGTCQSSSAYFDDTDTNTYNTTEEMQDAVGSAFTANFTYDDAGDSIGFNGANVISWLQGTFWDAIGDVPTATPSNGDTTHLSTADQIYDWVIGLSYEDEAHCSEHDGNYLSCDGEELDVDNTGVLGSSANIDASGNIEWEDAGELDSSGNIVSGSLDDEYIELGDSFGGEVSGTYGSLTLSNTALDDQYLDDTGDTMTGNLDMSNNNVTNSSYQTFCNGANCWKQYVNASGYMIIEEV